MSHVHEILKDIPKVAMIDDKMKDYTVMNGVSYNKDRFCNTMASIAWVHTSIQSE